MWKSKHAKILLIVGTKNILLDQNLEALRDLVTEETGETSFSILPDTSSRVTIATWQGLGAWLRKGRNLLRFELLIIDEAHNAGTSKRLDLIQQLNPRHTVGLTATAFRSTGTYKAPSDYGFQIVDSMTLP